MKYYRYLDLDWKTSSEKLKEYVLSNPNFSIADKSSWKGANKDDVLLHIPELQLMFDPLNIHIRYIAFFVSDFKEGVIHIDADTISKARINIPVLNCEHSETRFYKTIDEPVTIFQNNKVPLLRLNPSKCIHVDQFYLTQPVIFKNTEPHQVVSNNPIQPRISCTIAFHEDIEYLLYE